MEHIFLYFFWCILGVITLLAYKRPTFFRGKLAYPMLAFCVLCIVFISIYNIGGLGINVGNLVEEVSKSNAKNAVVKFYAERVNERYDLQIKTLLYGGLMSAYLLFLIFFPRIKTSLLNNKKEETSET